MADFSFADTNYGLAEASARRRTRQSNLQTQLGLTDLARRTERTTRDVTKAYRQAAAPQITGFTARGLGRSGVFERAMKEFVGAQQQRLGDIAAEQQAGQTKLELERQQAAQDLQDYLDQLQLSRQQQIISDAQTLRQYAPMSGLFS
jgi:hypothetical protein